MSADPSEPTRRGRPGSPSGPASSSIGPYRVLRPLGEGGMGQVFLAQQTAPIRREVALKVIRGGMASGEILARFEAERQALARMEHRCIAKVFDAGEAPDGSPYIAMEHVAGLPIDEYCERHQLDLTARLTLFIQVCEGVQHAHQKAVIHRDLKPTNVLVTEEDGRPVPKIIDFGLAKATAQSLTERTLLTRVGSILGTPEYMSPEQADFKGQDVDTRTDVYALGVILYVLVSGALPFDSGTLLGSGYDEMLRIIREVVPPRPSVRSGSSSSLRPGSDRASATGRRWPTRSAETDLDWIVLRALEKQRERRYQSPSELADDLQRLLANEPVEARPPSITYRVGKLVQRHRAAVTTAAAVLLLLVGGIVATTWGLVRARRAESRALLDAETSRQVTDFMGSLFEGANPHIAQGEEVTARQLLDLGSARIEAELADQPALQARLMARMGAGYRDLGRFPEARRLLEGAVARIEAHGLDDGDDASRTFAELASLCTMLGEYDQGRRHYERAIALARRNHGDRSLQVADSLAYAAFVRLRQGLELERVERDLQEALAIYEELDRGDDAGVASALMHLGWVRVQQGDDERALAPHLEALAMRRRLSGGEPSPSIAWSLGHIGHLRLRSGDHEEARRLFEEGLEISRRVYGEDHPEVAFLHRSLGGLYDGTGRPDLAAAQYRQAVAIYSDLDEPPPELSTVLVLLARCEVQLGELEQAETSASEARRICEARREYADGVRPALEELAGEIAFGRGDLDGARAAYRRAVELRLAEHGEDDPRTARARERLAGL